MKTILSAVISLLLRLDGVIYNFICYIFDIFYYLCGLQLFTNDEYGDIVNRIYIVLGLVMMFVLAYSLLKAVINPDEFAKGENSFPKLVKNIIVSLVIIVILPTAFQICFNIQNSLLNYDVIPQLILGTDDSENYETVDGVPTVGGVPGGRIIAYYTFKSFLVPDTEKSICNGADEEACRDNIKGNGDLTVTNGEALSLTNNLVLNEKGSFSKYAEYSEAIRDGDLTYYFPISTVAGVFIVWVLLNFCFDMALRVVKLAFYQMIAPIPVICRVIPGGKLKDVFSNWLKQVISLFVEVFVRIAALTFGVFLIGIIVQKFNEGLPGIDSLNLIGQKTIVLALLIMSVIIFVKQIPKIIGDMFGLDTSGMKLGLMDKLAQGGALAAGAFVGGGATSLARNAVNKFGKKDNWLNKDKKLTVGSVAKNLGAGLLSGAAGGLSGALRAGKGGLKAKNLTDMKKSASEGANAAVEKRFKREKYLSAHSRGKGFIDDAAMVLMGHAGDAAGSVVNWAGYRNLEQLKMENAAMDEITNSKDSMENSIDAYIEKQMNKGKGAGLGEAFSLNTLKDKKNALAKATAEGGDVVGTQKAYNDELKRIREAIANQLLVSSKAWESYDPTDRASLGELRVDAVKFKGAVYNNSNLDALKEVGIVGDDFAQDKDVAYGVTDSPLDKMGDSIKRHRGDNKVEIATRSQENNKDGK